MYCFRMCVYKRVGGVVERVPSWPCGIAKKENDACEENQPDERFGAGRFYDILDITAAQLNADAKAMKERQARDASGTSDTFTEHGFEPSTDDEQSGTKTIRAVARLFKKKRGGQK